MDLKSRKAVSSSSAAAESAGVSSQSRLRISETDQAAAEFIRTFREDLKIQRLNSMAAAAAKIDDFKVKKSLKRSDGFLRKSNFEMDVDKSADEFINRFRQNLKMERKDSLEKYQEMLNRGV